MRCKREQNKIIIENSESLDVLTIAAGEGTAIHCFGVHVWLDGNSLTRTKIEVLFIM